MTGDRRELGAAVLLCLVGACVVLVGAGRTWTSVDLPAGPLTGGRAVGVPGADLVPGVGALGLVGLAGVVALLATRRTGRLVLGGLLLLAGAGVVAGVVVPDLTAATLGSAQVAGAGPVAASAVGVTAWPWVTALGGAAVALAGLLTVLRGASWPGMGQRYEAPAARTPRPDVAGAPAQAALGELPPNGAAPNETALSEAALWEALDRGEDPTDTLGSSPGTRPTGEADRT